MAFEHSLYHVGFDICASTQPPPVDHQHQSPPPPPPPPSQSYKEAMTQMKGGTVEKGMLFEYNLCVLITKSICKDDSAPLHCLDKHCGTIQRGDHMGDRCISKQALLSGLKKKKNFEQVVNAYFHENTCIASELKTATRLQLFRGPDMYVTLHDGAIIAWPASLLKKAKLLRENPSEVKIECIESDCTERGTSSDVNCVRAQGACIQIDITMYKNENINKVSVSMMKKRIAEADYLKLEFDDDAQ
jgi:hypothetical protein